MVVLYHPVAAAVYLAVAAMAVDTLQCSADSLHCSVDTLDSFLYYNVYADCILSLSLVSKTVLNTQDNSSPACYFSKC